MQMAALRWLYFAMALVACSAISNGQSSTSQASRRRRRSGADGAHKDSNCEIMTKVMSALLAIQKELRTAKQEIKELQSSKHDVQKELNAVKEQIPPFKVSAKDKTVWLKGWNLHVESGDYTGKSATGNLIVGGGHNYKSSSDSFFSGYGHTALGPGVAFLGGFSNIAGNESGKLVAWGSPNFSGAAVAGGRHNQALGAFSFVGGGKDNLCSSAATGGVVLGGSSNKVTGETAAALGGHLNKVGGLSATSLGGLNNVVGPGGSHSTISGGQFGHIEGSFSATVSGGQYNSIKSGSSYSTINGGRNNTVRWGASHASIAGGYMNKIEQGASSATIAGGRENLVRHSAAASSIAGGLRNRLEAGAYVSTIAGGWENVVAGTAFAGAVGGGFGNSVKANLAGTIAGGSNNSMYGQFSSISGGLNNSIHGGHGHCGGRSADAGQQPSRRRRFTGTSDPGGCFNLSAWHTISGGAGNLIDTSGKEAFNDVIVGGQNNSIVSDSSFSTVLGGRLQKTMDKSWSVVVGGPQQTLLPQSAENGRMEEQQLSVNERQFYRGVLEAEISSADHEMDAAHAETIDLEQMIREAEASSH